MSRDFTGEVYKPSLPSRMKDLLLGQEKRRREFWTAERLELANAVVENVCQRTKEYGVKPFSFSPEQIVLVDRLGEDLLRMPPEKMSPLTGKIWLVPHQVGKKSKLVGVLAHAYYHVCEHRTKYMRLKLIPPRIEEGGRFGLSFLTRKGEGLGWLDEGVVESSAQTTAKEVLGYATFHLPYPERTSIIRDFCYQIAFSEMTEDGRLEDVVASGVKKRAREVFEDFERATYGKGQLLPISRRINRVYKEWGGFKEFVSRVERLTKLERELKREEIKRGEKDRLRADCGLAIEELGSFARGPFPRIPEGLLERLGYEYDIPPVAMGISPLRLMFLVKERLGEKFAVCQDELNGPIRLREITEEFAEDRLSGQRVYCSGEKGRDGVITLSVTDESLWDQVVSAIRQDENLEIVREGGRYVLEVRDNTIGGREEKSSTE